MGRRDCEKKYLRRWVGFCVTYFSDCGEAQQRYLSTCGMACSFCHSQSLHALIVALPVLLVLIVSWSLALNLHLFELHLTFRVSADIVRCIIDFALCLEMWHL